MGIFLACAKKRSVYPDGHKPQECKICLDFFDTNEKRPRSLPCGHTFCTHCIGDLIKNMKISCPHCRAKHVLKHATELPVSYIVEEFMAKEKYDELSKNTVTTTCQTVESGSCVKEQDLDCYVGRSAVFSTRHPNVSVSKSACCSSVCRKMCKCFPNWMKLKRRPWRRDSACSVREIGAQQLSQIYAVKEENNRIMSAVMRIHEGRMYLHTLRNQPAPSSRTLKHSDMVALLDSTSTTTFLDLAWDGTVKGRVLIQLYARTTCGQIFLQLCTGERGPSYANTHFLEVHFKDRPGEYILAGGSMDSEEVHRKIANGNEVNDIMCQTTGKAGLVWGRAPSDISRFGQFAITTRDPGQSNTYMQVLGRVVRGLDVVSEAVQHSNITEVKIVDCGVLVPL